MVGDIDFIFSKIDFPKAITLLKEFGYDKEIHQELPYYRHYPRIIRKDSIAAVEIHKDLLSEKYVNEFNYNFVVKDSQVIKWHYSFELCKQIKLIHYSKSNKR